MQEKSKSSRPDMNEKEFKAVRSVKFNKDIKIVMADNGKCSVMSDGYEYKDNLNTFSESGLYEPLTKDPTARADIKVQKLLAEHKTALPTDLKGKLTPYHSRTVHLYYLPKANKPDIPLKPTVRSY
jgi:hypothetical protein